jgi:hypothetical protein
MAYTLTPNEGGEATLRLKPLESGDEVVVSLGAPPAPRAGAAPAGGRGAGAGVGAPSFSDDSKWVTYTAPVAAARGAAGAANGRNAPPPSGQPGRAPAPAAAGTTPPAARLELRNLATGAVTRFANVASSSFSPNARYLVLRMNRPTGAATASVGADLVLHDLSTGSDRNTNVGKRQITPAACRENPLGDEIIHSRRSQDRDITARTIGDALGNALGRVKHHHRGGAGLGPKWRQHIQNALQG